MSKYVDKVTYTLDLKDYTDKKITKQLTNEVGQYLVEQILDDVSQSKSPVNGQRFVGLTKEYKNIKKNYSSSTAPNMELTGDLLDSLIFKSKGSKIEVGIFDFDQAQKADNHNKFSGASKKTSVPKRQFIPYEDQRFRKGIERSIIEIVKEIVEN